ncbi:MAG: PGPGW domain-containing protein [Acidimicrobiia bacterium]|nr:PGPGW domain-containing protein [Acidimicrobiia bacterium]
MDERRTLGRRVTTIVTGSAVTLVGVALLVLPGPGIVTIGVGLNILGREIPAARRLLDRVRRSRRDRD